MIAHLLNAQAEILRGDRCEATASLLLALGCGEGTPKQRRLARVALKALERA